MCVNKREPETKRMQQSFRSHHQLQSLQTGSKFALEDAFLTQIKDNIFIAFQEEIGIEKLVKTVILQGVYLLFGKEPGRGQHSTKIFLINYFRYKSFLLIITYKLKPL